MLVLKAFLLAFELLSANASADAKARMPRFGQIPEQSVTGAPDQAEESEADSIEEKDDRPTRTQQPDASAAASAGPQADYSPDPGKGVPNGSQSEADNDRPY